MNIKGELCLSRKNDNYMMFSGGKTTNMTEVLDSLLLESVCIRIRKAVDESEIINIAGKLIKEKTSPCYYQYHINKINVDEILWNLVGSKIILEVSNVSKR